MTGRVIELTSADVIWPFGQTPYVDAGYHTTIDPTPAYGHDLSLVASTLRKVDRIVGKRVLCKPIVYVLHHECESRTNGFAFAKAHYPKPAKGAPPWEGFIVLPAKRIPIHPAMTRYVVAHEYGHHAEMELLRRRGLTDSAPDIVREYAELRGADPHVPYGAGRWHETAGELLANDFRILVCGIETEFWPHPGFEHPSKLKLVRRWWEANL